TNLPSLSSRAFGCGPTKPGSIDGAVIRNCVRSGGAVPADGNVTVPEIVAPGISTTVRSDRSLPLTLTGSAAYCGVSVSSPRARTSERPGGRLLLVNCPSH